MRLKIFCLLIHLFILNKIIYAQVVNEHIVQEDEAYTHSTADWIPSMLNATSNPLYNFVAYNGRIFSWNLRGETKSAKIIDGINWQSNIRQWSSELLVPGLGNMFKRNEILLNGVHSKSGYWAYPTISIVSSENTQEKKSFSVLNSFSATHQTNNLKTISIVYHSGLMAKQTKLSAAVKMEDAPFGVLPNGYKQQLNLFLSIDKNWNHLSSIGLSLFWNLGDQGRAATYTNEVFALSRQRAYSPNWGWYQQKVYYPSTRQTNTPIITLRYQKKWDARKMLTVNNGIILGVASSSNLEWTRSADPRPDYYKYLPSYIADTALSNQLLNWYLQHPENLQINFDQLARINKTSASRRSFYIVNQENQALLMLHGAVLFANNITPTFNFQMGVQYAWDQIHFYNTIKDLLGGDFFYNYNGWMNDDSLALSFQQDVLHPDKKVKQGEKWGADYSIRSFQIKPWMQLQKLGPIMESSISVGYGVEGTERIGYNQNGLFANSKGTTGFTVFSNADAKAQLLYKFNGRIYIRTILFARWLAPKYQRIFLDPEINIASSPYTLQEQEYGGDISVFYRAPGLKSSISYFQNLHYNATENKMFYQDAYALFVYGNIGNINSMNRGVEFVLETNLFQNLKLNYAATFSSSNYLETASYQYLDVNNLQIKESGWLQIKNLSSSNSPRLVNAISLLYQPVFGFTLGLTTIHANDRPVSPNLFRRSDWVKGKVDPITWGQIQQLELLANQFSMNAFVSKFFQSKIKNTNKAIRWSTSLGVRNILNTIIPVIAYEQTRFDYLRFNKNKFPLKYLMDAGTSFSLRIQLQIQ
jgi:hypothetical protein